ncbi:bacteriohemerythrin [Hydrogenophaga sp. BPS33]|uniref:bacteriohemerythrin n=1 Tax=Hydrogenophaga sp. BPS33 TaxID=2651974 RepID=UPI00131FF548|nr:hemerythrin domain-containing protein [Hydrogenophaga sp. BPS33]QHE83490.1 hemerythrin [Hydrogenophaga sp. BPS33]
MNASLAHGFAWDEAFSVHHASMDDTHHEFVDCLDALLRASDAQQHAALNAFEDHARRHFQEEDQAMRESAYGSAGCHVDEHAAVLKSLDEVRAVLAEGRHDVVRAFALALADWFPRHAQVMDLGLARWLQQRRLGGAPVSISKRAVSALA